MGDLSDNFNRSEFECKCKCKCGFATVDIDMIKVLEDVRWHFGQPITIMSGCRCDEHNRAIRGATHSKHKQGIAVDFVVWGGSPRDIAAYLNAQYPDKYGVGDYPNFTHLDLRPNKARWVIE